MTQLFQENFISTKEASRRSGYNSDYLARLCRSKKIVGQQVGRTWVVRTDSLEKFIRDQEVHKREIAENLSRERARAYKTATSNFLKSAAAPSKPLLLRPSFALAMSLFVVVGIGYASTSDAMARLESGVVRVAHAIAHPGIRTYEGSVTFLGRPAPHASESARALIDSDTFMAHVERAVAHENPIPHDAVALSVPDFKPVALARIDRTIVTFREPVVSLVHVRDYAAHAYLGMGARIERGIRDGLDGYAAALTATGDGAFAGALSVRDNVARASTIPARLTHAYAQGVYAWVNGTPEFARTVTEATLLAGDTLGSVAAEAPRYAATASGDALARITGSRTTFALSATGTGEVTADGTAGLGALPRTVTQAFVRTFVGMQRVIQTAFANGTAFVASLVSPSTPPVVIRPAPSAPDSVGQTPSTPTTVSTFTSTVASLVTMPAGSPALAGSTIIQNYFPQTTVYGVTEALLNERLAQLESTLRKNIQAASERTRSSNDDDDDDDSGNGAPTENPTFTGLLTADEGDFGGNLAVGGDADITGTLTVGTFAVANLSSNNAIVAPAFVATSTSVASSFTSLIASSTETEQSTSTSLYASTFGLGGSYFTSLLGTGLVNTGGALTVATSSLTSTFFAQGGNAFAAPAAFGTTDAQSLSFLTNNATVGTFLTNGNFGIGTTSPGSKLSVAGNGLFSGSVSAASVTATGTATVGSLSVGSLTGFLKATAGSVTTSLINLSSDITGTLPVGNGGTGSTSLSGILVGNGTSSVGSLTLSAPLSLTGSTLSINQANGSVSGYLSSTDWNTFNNKISSTSLSGGTGISYNSATGVITNTGITSTAGDWMGTFDGQEGSYYLANSFSTTSAAYFLAQNPSSSGFSTTSANNWLGTKSTSDLGEGSNLYFTDARSRGALAETITGIDYNSGTGILSLASGYVLPLSASTSNWDTAYAWGNHAAQNYFDKDTDDTDDLLEGGNLFYTNTRVLSYLDTLSKGYFFSTTSADYWKTQNNFFSTTSANTWLAGKSTTDLGEGTNLYYQDARARAAISFSAMGLTYNSATGALSLTPGYVIPTSASTTDWQTAFTWGNHATVGYITDGNTGWDNVYNLFDRDTDDTGDITEGANLFYTNARVLSYLDTFSKGYFFSTTSANYFESTQGPRSADDLSNNTTSDLAEGSNLYYSLARFSAALAGTTTDALPEGTTNRYFTEARVLSYLDTLSKGYFFSTTSANYFETTQGPRSADDLSNNTTSDLAEGTNLYYTQGRFDTAFGAKDTDDLLEGSSRLYYTDGRARAAVSSSATGVAYNSATGVFSLTAGYSIPLTASTTDWNTAYTNRITSASAPLAISNNAISISQSSGSMDGYLSSTDWNTFNNKISSTSLSGGTGISYNSATGVITNTGVTSTAGDWTGTFDGQEGSYYLANSFSTTSANYLLSSLDKGYFFSTTSANYFESTQGPRSADDLSNNTTSDLAEGSNLYYSLARFAAALAGTTTSALAEGTNLYYQDARVQTYLDTLSKGYFFSTTSANAYLATKNTDSLAEGTTNLYYTDARTRAALSFSGTGLAYNNASGVLSVAGGYAIPLTASTTEWNAFYTNPASRITAGTNLSWSGNTLNGPTDTYIRSLFSAGTGLSYNSGTGAFALNATGDWSGTFDGQEGSYYLANSFSSTSAAYYESTQGPRSADDLSNNTTSDLNEGTNLYFTDARADARLTATTSLPNLTTLAGLSTVGTITSGTWQGSLIAQAYGGTGFATYTPGDILYADNSGNLARLPVGSSGQVLKVSAGMPSWGVDLTLGSSGGGDGVWATTTSTIYPIETSNTVLIGNNATTTQNSIFEVTGQSYFSNKIGIGTTSPAALLSVSGTAYVTGATTLGSTLGVSGLATFASGIQVGGETVTDLTGSGIILSGNALTLDRTGDWLGTFDGQEGSYYLANSFSTTSANAYLATKTTTNLAEGSNLYYTDARVLTYLNTLAKGYYFSTTSAAYFESTQGPRTADDLSDNDTDDLGEGTGNLYYTLARFAAALAGTTTDALAEGTTNIYYTDARVLSYLDTFSKNYFFSTTSTDYWKTQNDFFSTTSSNAWLATKTTSDIAEGGNLYWTDARFDTRLSGTSTLPNLTTLVGLSSVGTITSGTWQGTAIGDAYLTKTGNWTGTFDGQEGSYYLANSFSTTSANAYLATKTTDNLGEGTTNLYFSNTRARAALSSNATGLTYTAGTGVFSLTAGYSIPTTASQGNWDTAYGWGDHASAGYITDGNTGWDNTYNLFDKDTDDTGDITEGSNLFFTNARVLTYLDSLDKGYFFSTTSANYFETTQGPRSADDLSNNTTSDLAEGSNLYYTLARFAAALAGTTTSALAEGSNLYWTQARFNTAFGLKSTSDLSEGSNLYFTNDRADARINATTTIGTLTSLPNLATVGTITTGTWQGTAI
ncbi:MAG TPA: helix-turn-helix domain-containing protein, partial [Candidatus Paceibacterota bacterium]